MTNKIRLTCAGCGLDMLVPTVYVGKRVRCKRCNAPVLVEQSMEGTPVLEERSEDWPDRELEPSVPVTATSHSEEPCDPPPLVWETSQTPTAAEAANENSIEVCPLPGLLLGQFLGTSPKEGFLRPTSSLSRIVGYGYLLIAGATFFWLVLGMVRNGVNAATTLLIVWNTPLSGLFLIVLHYANHTCEQLSGSMLRSPTFFVASMRHLQLAAVPFMLLGIAATTVALPITIVTLLQPLGGGGSFGVVTEVSRLYTPLLMIFLGLSVCCLLVRVLLNPAKVGIEVNPDASAAETMLAIIAAIARAPLLIVAVVHRSGVVAGCCATCAQLVIASWVSNDLIDVVIVICWLWCIAALLWPIVAYGGYFVSMFGVDILQSFFQLARNVSIIAKQNQREDLV